jgi:hypothetical protein
MREQRSKCFFQALSGLPLTDTPTTVSCLYIISYLPEQDKACACQANTLPLSNFLTLTEGSKPSRVTGRIDLSIETITRWQISVSSHKTVLFNFRLANLMKLLQAEEEEECGKIAVV